ncbi:MAG TPA: sugar transferase [Flavobacterium sp.]|uniref:sugar transferase n=1 Tax=Flavobacterium sp. TaxID=239 RepID=UPI002DB844C1|nr:sugar transferase [Flavobacterium sp.]HEU4788934.1 sugar transferase [Flavobacterium sp.]
MYKSFFKRTLDILGAFFGLLLLSPLFIVIMMGLFFVNHGKPFFFQLRPGKDEKSFNIIKFKTMNDKKDGYGNLLPDAQRLTKIGIFVRKTSLDEIPQLLNVIKGDMSLIGPRPLLPEYLPLYNEEQKRRHELRPGITGWAQVNGRNAISWQKKFKYDIEYIDNLDFKFDCKIIFLTIKKVLKSEGINLKEQLSAEYFNGNN